MDLIPSQKNIIYIDNIHQIINLNTISDNYNELNKFMNSRIIEKTEKYITNVKSNIQPTIDELKEKPDEKYRKMLLHQLYKRWKPYTYLKRLFKLKLSRTHKKSNIECK